MDGKKAYGQCSKCSRFTYGIQTSDGFTPGEHPCFPTHIHSDSEVLPDTPVKKPTRRRRKKK